MHSEIVFEVEHQRPSSIRSVTVDQKPQRHPRVKIAAHNVMCRLSKDTVDMLLAGGSSSVKSFPVPLKSFDCFALIEEVSWYEPAVRGTVTLTVTLSCWPGASAAAELGLASSIVFVDVFKFAVHGAFPKGGVTVGVCGVGMLKPLSSVPEVSVMRAEARDWLLVKPLHPAKLSEVPQLWIVNVIGTV